MNQRVVDRFTIDDSRWPFVIFRIPPESPDAVVVEMMARMGAVLERGRCAFVYDVPQFVMPNPRQRRLLVDGLRAARARHPNHIVCNAVATRLGPMMTGMITAVSWLMAASEPTRVFQSVDDAVAWAQGMLIRPELERTTEHRY